jgi:hypothetical protein
MTDVRSLVRQARDSRRITHPYAKYNTQGALFCAACAQKILAEAQWQSHINSPQHKEKVHHVIRASQRKAKRGIAASAMEAEEEEEDESSRKRIKVSEPEPAIEDNLEELPAPEDQALPEDFFDEGLEPAKKDVDEDEWQRFQSEIAETIRNQEEGNKDEEEEIQRVILEELDDINTFENRVERLKKRRVELQQIARSVPAAAAEVDQQAEEDDDNAEVEEEWW